MRFKIDLEIVPIEIVETTKNGHTNFPSDKRCLKVSKQTSSRDLIVSVFKEIKDFETRSYRF